MLSSYTEDTLLSKQPHGPPNSGSVGLQTQPLIGHWHCLWSHKPLAAQSATPTQHNSTWLCQPGSADGASAAAHRITSAMQHRSQTCTRPCPLKGRAACTIHHPRDTCAHTLLAWTYCTELSSTQLSEQNTRYRSHAHALSTSDSVTPSCPPCPQNGSPAPRLNTAARCGRWTGSEADSAFHECSLGD